MHIELYRGIAGLLQLQSNWASLLARARRPRFYHAYGWWLAYLVHLESNPDSVCFFLFRDARGPQAILPVKHYVRWWHGLPRRELGFPEHPHLPMHDMLYGADVNVPELLTQWQDSLRTEHRFGWDVMSFGMMLPESQLNGLVQEPTAAIRIDPPCSYIDCNVTYDQLSQNFSKNFRTNLKKARNRLDKTPGASFVTATEPADLDRYFGDFLRVEASGWKGSAGSGTAIALHPSLKNFYRSLIDQFVPQRRVCIYALQIEDQVIAAGFCLRDDHTLYLLKIAYDEAWAKLSPGQLLMEKIVRDGTDLGKHRNVNLVTDAVWHKDWRARQFEMRTIRLANKTPVGHLFHLAMLARQNMGPLYHRWLALRFQARSKKGLA